MWFPSYSSISQPQIQNDHDRWLLRFQISLTHYGRKTFHALSEWNVGFQISSFGVVHAAWRKINNWWVFRRETPLLNSPPNCTCRRGLGSVSRKPRKLFGPVKPLQNLKPCEYRAVLVAYSKDEGRFPSYKKFQAYTLLNGFTDPKTFRGFRETEVSPNRSTMTGFSLCSAGPSLKNR